MNKLKGVNENCPVCFGDGWFDVGDNVEGNSQYINCPSCEREVQLRLLRTELAMKNCIDEENAVLTLWARDLQDLLAGKEKLGIRGGLEMEAVEIKIVALVAASKKE